MLKVFKPANFQHLSASAMPHKLSGPETFDMPVKALTTIMRELGHTQIDLLKMDIESAEYGVIDALAATDLPIGQLLIEFHHRFESVGPQATIDALARLNRAGFKVFAISSNSEEFSLVKACRPLLPEAHRPTLPHRALSKFAATAPQLTTFHQALT